MTDENQIEKSEARIAFEDKIAKMRASFLAVETEILSFKTDPFLAEPATAGVNGGEAIANIMLAYRHTEDARMRLGKVFQALDGGKSPLPR